MEIDNMKRLGMIGIILLSMVNIAGFAQNIRYYSLQKITQLNKVDTKCSGGQFVNIKEYVCFDSDKDGKSVGNGKLYIDKKNTDVSQIVYVGSSYHGNSRYIFSKDFSILKVEINPHYIYEYRLSTPPKSALTCSLIKKDNSSKAPSYSNPVFIQGNNDWDFGESLNNLDGTENISVNGNSNSSPQNQTRFKCAYCNNGRIEKNDNAPANFGINKPKRRCSECGKSYDPSVFNHYHIQCRHCGGTGYAK